MFISSYSLVVFLSVCLSACLSVLLVVFLLSFLRSFLPSLHFKLACQRRNFNRTLTLFHFILNMASSQRDMFAASSPEVSPRVRSSLPVTLSYVYLWVILFDWDENVEDPFSLYQVALFRESELKPKWISGDLDVDSRQKKISFTTLPGKTFSLFAKVEKCEYLLKIYKRFYITRFFMYYITSKYFF